MSVQRIDDCCRRPDEIVKIEHRPNNLVRLYHQCLNCGGANRTKPLSHKKYSSMIRMEFDIFRFEKWKSKREKENNDLRESIIHDNFETSNYGKYVNYLNSAEWKNLRIRVFERDKNTCQECKNKTAEQVHHITYENLFNEPLEDLVSVCVECHSEIHKRLDIEKIEKIKLSIRKNKSNC
ncbi:hypothetical protein J2Q11_14130 [Tenacibaculum finnmarkense genomovar finnmarkense]|uniref:HNH endonuclease n=1 Tax=Tenacibaculum finnmarkense TaxID=2781243 RepID=UPI001E450C48|nr:hypothetical protein [Tenacibaculum finnmarkense]MCD8418864.1 hypothetical protein [Tenacibaculum finnmarkense genomovar finnmarkense]MCG8187153.1 hypothetical protein [Tenacibaculum finnmarkense genomovar finnmarkense]MCG8203738.1 hypothetical protein [Tenacibaculum finnmarkense genomovar finnmarkense]MCG8211212.1 hypothetical protein [Tenacibaculum finnmarkense genomovar finnmarkense]MCG8213950.1 hypothetical protein [Tenacibaculum finnmarkense genomovar finnmarkense]